MSDINLLPVNRSAADLNNKTLSLIKKVTATLAVLFIVASLIGIVAIIFLTRNNSSILAHQASQKQQIETLVSTEQKLYLIKDRLGKIKETESMFHGEDALKSLDSSLSALSSNITIDSIDIDASKTQFTIKAQNSETMASFLNSLVVSGAYKDLLLTNFFFSPLSGYTLTLTIPGTIS